MGSCFNVCPWALASLPPVAPGGSSTMAIFLFGCDHPRVSMCEARSSSRLLFVVLALLSLPSSCELPVQDFYGSYQTYQLELVRIIRYLLILGLVTNIASHIPHCSLCCRGNRPSLPGVHINLWGAVLRRLTLMAA